MKLLNNEPLKGGTEGQVNRMRLIDAETFIESLGLDVENAREDNIGEIVTLEDFDRQATAFDKEKVIEELKANMNSVLGISGQAVTFMFSDGYYNGVKDAIEIVEKGGIE